MKKYFKHVEDLSVDMQGKILGGAGSCSCSCECDCSCRAYCGCSGSSQKGAQVSTHESAVNRAYNVTRRNSSEQRLDSRLKTIMNY